MLAAMPTESRFNLAVSGRPSPTHPARTADFARIALNKIRKQPFRSMPGMPCTPLAGDLPGPEGYKKGVQKTYLHG